MNCHLTYRRKDHILLAIFFDYYNIQKRKITIDFTMRLHNIFIVALIIDIK